MCGAATKTMNTMPSFIIDKAGGVFFVKTAKGFEVFRIIIRDAKRLKNQLGVTIAKFFFGKFNRFWLNQQSATPPYFSGVRFFRGFL